MSTLQLITAVDPARAEHLAACATSVRSAVTFLRGRGWQVQWTVAVDGPGKLPRFHSGDHTTLRRLPHRFGVAAARTAAFGLGDATVDWVTVVDADDLVVAPMLMEALTVTGNASWAVTNHSPLEAGAAAGPRIARSIPFPAGDLAGTWVRGWPFHPGNLLARASAVAAVGGWPAVPACEDAAMLLSLSEAFDGVALPHATLRRRTWPGQRSADAGFGDAARDGAWLTARLVNAARGWRHPGAAAVHPPGR